MIAKGVVVTLAVAVFVDPSPAQQGGYAARRAASGRSLAQVAPALVEARQALPALQALAALPAIPLVPPAPPAVGIVGWAFAATSDRDAGPRATAPEPWIQEDPGTAEYTAARQALNNGRYEAAAQGFAVLRRTRPQSGYVPDSYYFEAFALSRMGERPQLTRAIELLDEQRTRFPQAPTRADADALRVRIEAQLAQRGDAQAAANIARQAAGASSSGSASQAACGGDQEVRAAALSALLNMNAERAIPILQEVLRSRDECSVELRRQAVFLVSQKMTAESVDILLDLAHRNPDPDPEVREQAVFWLSQVRGEQAMDALEAILRESTDEELRENAIFAISQHGSERGVRVLREFAERPDAATSLRENAIFWIGQNPGAGGTQYLIELYGRLEDEELKGNVIFGVSQSNTEEARRWLVERAMDQTASVELRKDALFWAGQSGALSLAELRSLYDSLGLADREVKEQVIFVASQWNNGEGVDFLMEVARTEQDSELRENAIFWLGQSNDPRVPEFLLQLIRG
jgi:HEAT repeat protein